MKQAILDRKTFLRELLRYAEESGTFNPHFRLGEMLSRLGVDEGTFNILRYSIGDQYCYLAGIDKGEPRYAINLSGCLGLKDQFDRDDRESERHNRSTRIAVLAAVLGAVVGSALTLLFSALLEMTRWPTSTAPFERSRLKKGVGAFAFAAAQDRAPRSYLHLTAEESKGVLQK